MFFVGQQLEEVVVVGYGFQKEKEIIFVVILVSVEDFNQGLIIDFFQLLQGKVVGFQVYNWGGDFNGQSVICLCGIFIVGVNIELLVVVDGIIGVLFDNVDLNDIENVIVLKDGLVVVIYGLWGFLGVILVIICFGS